MGWDNERFPRTKKDTLHLSFISFGISYSRFSDFGTRISFLVLGYPRDIPKTSKDTPGISSTWSYPWPIPEKSHRYPKTIRFILGVGIRITETCQWTRTPSRMLVFQLRAFKLTVMVLRLKFSDFEVDGRFPSRLGNPFQQPVATRPGLARAREARAHNGPGVYELVTCIEPIRTLNVIRF
jgi:hypothetical protein